MICATLEVEGLSTQSFSFFGRKMRNVNALMSTGSRKSMEGDHGLQRKPREITLDQDHKKDLEEPSQSIGSDFSC